MLIEKDCIVEHDGHKFEAGGAVVTEDICFDYCSDFSCACIRHDKEELYHWYKLTNWKGDLMGKVCFTAKWRTPQSYISSHMFQALAEVNGVLYTGRTRGFGMIFRGKRKK